MALLAGLYHGADPFGVHAVRELSIRRLKPQSSLNEQEAISTQESIGEGDMHGGEEEERLYAAKAKPRRRPGLEKEAVHSKGGIACGGSRN